MEAGSFVQVFWRDEAGVTAIEYALVGSLIAVAIVTSAAMVGLSLGDLYDTVATRVKDAITG